MRARVVSIDDFVERRARRWGSAIRVRLTGLTGACLGGRCRGFTVACASRGVASELDDIKNGNKRQTSNVLTVIRGLGRGRGSAGRTVGISGVMSVSGSRLGYEPVDGRSE